MQKLFSLGKIKPNPFRYMDRYPIQRDKVEALKQSFRRTGFWENLVAREVKGHAEIAYGHHRLVALQEEMGPRAKVPLIIKDLDDGAMLQMMARENMDEWRTSAVVEQETVRAVVEAYAAGKIVLPEIPKDTKKTVIRHAPSYVQGEENGNLQAAPYTATAIAEFLGWADPKIHTTLSALELIEQDVPQGRALRRAFDQAGRGPDHGNEEDQADLRHRREGHAGRKGQEEDGRSRKTRGGQGGGARRREVADGRDRLQAGLARGGQVSCQARRQRRGPRPTPLRTSSSRRWTDS